MSVPVPLDRALRDEQERCAQPLVGHGGPPVEGEERRAVLGCDRRDAPVVGRAAGYASLDEI